MTPEEAQIIDAAINEAAPFIIITIALIGAAIIMNS